ncbi:glycoside hydrolase family 127 protein [Neolewinella agarilytica]|uniref:DUF1680 family protein n=1 Tax=Neolewinella agarilytica TaxID=478744 RepID=A0A1H9KLX8_9BACT|nr:beta-L-arabinofuranosidase domain-containing protein [Neolewinella agarilytica]SER00156.1 hypothetical protein SAMN05444359_12123 [Neolewinella agarilytica]
MIATTPHRRSITDTSQSTFAQSKSINIGDCQWTEGFWAKKFRQCEEVMIPYMGALLQGDIGHAYNNFKIAAGLMQGEAKGMLWHDGDFYKWMEAAIHVYGNTGNESVIAGFDDIIKVIGQAQEADGYLSTHVQIKGLGRWTKVTNHELYNSGHLITGACLHFRVTGKTNWLDIAIKHADYLGDVFEPQTEALARFGFNPSQIMALVELYRTTGEKRYLKLAETFVNMRGAVPLELHPSVPYWFTGDQCQMKTPLRQETEATGHAVTGMYLYAGAADVYAETGEKELLDALKRIWSSAIERKMYITGALGQVHHGARDDQNMIHEGFVDDYLMPNSTAYNETCANIANAMFNWRMLSITGEAKYAEIIELVLFNSALVGISADGKHYFYANPLRMTHGAREYTNDPDCTESAEREPYIPCFCCPPNLVRTIAKVSGWAYSLREDGIAINLYGGNKLKTTFLDGAQIELAQVTDYPWEGRVEVQIKACPDAPFSLYARIPAWAEGTRVFINGTEVNEPVAPGTFLRLYRGWRAGDRLTLEMPMEPRLVEGHPRIEEVRNQVAVMRGPLVYCIESPDLPEGTSILDVYLSGDHPLRPVHQRELLGGITTISAELKLRKHPDAGMYHRMQRPEWERRDASFVPYYAWSNRGKSEMTVWVPVLWS